MPQPRSPDGRFTQTEADTNHNHLLLAALTRPAKHSQLFDAMYPTSTPDVAPSPGAEIEPDPEINALAFRS